MTDHNLHLHLVPDDEIPDPASARDAAEADLASEFAREMEQHGDSRLASFKAAMGVLFPETRK